ncbi:hypothetical protein KFE25_010325 [Diacronema lutheri]|uniref:Uncharacterized protein n=1 Tax=Diacronema lutheri TaxID=2081491 RepID=A0A8J6CAD7_DIALT|nr:hypothetical protein KFE25_010325 [Diacronema lutheri]
MLRSHVAEAEEFLSTPYTALVAQLPIHPLLPVDSEPPRSGLSQRAHALCHADQYVHKGDVFDVHLRATIKSGGVFLKLSNGRGWVAELTPLGEKIVGEATLTPCTDIFRVLSESLRIRKSASRTDVALSMRVTKVDADGARAPELVYADAFEAAGSVLVRGDKYLRLKDGRGYVLAMDGSIPLVARVQPQVGVWMYKVTYAGGIGVRHIASTGDAHRLAPVAEREHPANLPHGTAVECDVRVLKRIAGSIVAFARLRDGTGWIYSHKDGKALLELIAHDYASGPADEDVAAELGDVDYGLSPAAPMPTEEVEARAAAAQPVENPALALPHEGERPPAPLSPQRTVLGSRDNATNREASILSPASRERETLEVVKVSSANLHAASSYSRIKESDEERVVDAVASLSRIWPMAA